jgi:hypothetical protein
MEELRSRHILRGANAPAGDYAEWLFSKAFGWKLENNSNAGYDAVAEGKRIQIKCRRLQSPNQARPLGIIRDLDRDPFDVLAAVLLNADYTVQRAALIPIAVIKTNAAYIHRVNGHRLVLRDSIWQEPGVIDVTEKLKSAVDSDEASPALVASEPRRTKGEVLDWLREQRQALPPMNFDSVALVREERDDF